MPRLAWGRPPPAPAGGDWPRAVRLGAAFLWFFPGRRARGSVPSGETDHLLPHNPRPAGALLPPVAPSPRPGTAVPAVCPCPCFCPGPRSRPACLSATHPSLLPRRLRQWTDPIQTPRCRPWVPPCGLLEAAGQCFCPRGVFDRSSPLHPRGICPFPPVRFVSCISENCSNGPSSDVPDSAPGTRHTLQVTPAPGGGQQGSSGSSPGGPQGPLLPPSAAFLSVFRLKFFWREVGSLDT